MLRILVLFPTFVSIWIVENEELQKSQNWRELFPCHE